MQGRASKCFLFCVDPVALIGHRMASEKKRVGKSRSRPRKHASA